MSTLASVMCTLCEANGTVETDVSKPEAVASAVAWAVHFASVHPDVPHGVSRHLVMTEQESAVQDHTNGRSER